MYILPILGKQQNKRLSIQGMIFLMDDILSGPGYVRHKPSRPFGVAFYINKENSP